MNSATTISSLLRQQVAALTLSNYVFRIMAAAEATDEAGRAALVAAAKDCHSCASLLQRRLGQFDPAPPINNRLLLARAVHVARLRLRGELKEAAEVEQSVVEQATRLNAPLQFRAPQRPRQPETLAA